MSNLTGYFYSAHSVLLAHENFFVSEFGLGTFRFVLALLVTLSHFPGSYMRLNFGVAAVLGFYFISGWLMAMSYRRFQTKTETPTKAFFIDRFIKLWPSYILVFTVSIVFFQVTGIFDFDWRRAILEIFILPNALTKMIPWHYHALTIVPPSWSLGVEAWFYLTVPILALLTYKTKIRLAYVMVFGHTVVLMIGKPISTAFSCFWPIREEFCTIPISDYFGMDFPIFVGVTFLLGSLAFERFTTEKKDNHLFIIWAVYAFHFLIGGPALRTITNLTAYEVLFAMSIILPMACCALIITRNQEQPQFDRLLGDLSYPLFLTHFLARYVVEFMMGPMEGRRTHFLIALAVSLLFSFIVMYWQKSVDGLRYKVRGFGTMQRRPRPAGIA